MKRLKQKKAFSRNGGHILKDGANIPIDGATIGRLPNELNVASVEQI